MRVYELIIRFRHYRCKEGYIWCTDGSFVDPNMFKSSDKIAYGYVLNDHTVASLKRSELMRTWSEAKSYCTECTNDGKSGYLPSSSELQSLYSSIMSSKMKSDLITAGIYEMCNYRLPAGADDASEPNWWHIWSRDEYSANNAYNVGYYGSVYANNKSTGHYFIPFFKF